MGYIVQHGEQIKYFIITINGVEHLQIVNHQKKDSELEFEGKEFGKRKSREVNETICDG